jgi:uncharacterized protein
MSKLDSILGRGVRFPFRPGADGGFSLIDGEDNVAQAIVLILATAMGERQMRFQFGSRLPRMIYEPITAATLAAVESAARDALRDCERRIRVLDLAAVADPDIQSKVNLTIDYQILKTNRRGNLVFPFYLSGG